jgi:hypothetical protein
MSYQTFEDIVADLQSSGVIFGAEYIKKDGTRTKVNGRFGVHKFTKGTGVSSPKVLTIWDNNRKRYTSLIPEKIVSISCWGSKYKSIPTILKDSLENATSR